MDAYRYGEESCSLQRILEEEWLWATAQLYCRRVVRGKQTAL